MHNYFEKNHRHYPVAPKKKDNIIALPIRASSNPLNTTKEEDMNDWGGLIEKGSRKGISEEEEVKYGPGNYPDDDEEVILPPAKEEATEKLIWIIPDILAGGPHPIHFSHKISLKELADAGIKTIISISSEIADRASVKYFEFENLFVPTLDATKLHQLCHYIDQQEARKKPVYVHCFMGSKITGTVLAAYLMYKNYLTCDEAIVYVRQKYDKNAIPTDHHERVLRSLSVKL